MTSPHGWRAELQTMEPKAAYRTMDTTRAVAAFAVVWGHCFNHVLAPGVGQAGPLWRVLAASAGLGRDAVLVFFVISGFWIARSVERAIQEGSWSWRDYLVSRLSRLWIVLLPALAIGGSLDALGRLALAPHVYSGFAVNGVGVIDIGDRLDLVTLLGNILFLQELAVPAWGSNVPLWTLACEFWYYIWFPALLLAIAHRRFSILAIVLTAATMAIGPNVLALFPCWLLGAGLQRLVAKADVIRKPVLRFGLLAGGAALFVLGLALGHTWRSYYPGCYAISLGFAALLYAVLRCDFGLPRFMAPVARYGAMSSFSLYALHAPIMVFALAVTIGENRLTASLPALGLAVGLSLALVAVCWLFSRQTEYRTAALRKRVMARLTAPKPAPFR